MRVRVPHRPLSTSDCREGEPPRRFECSSPKPSQRLRFSAFGVTGLNMRGLEQGFFPVSIGSGDNSIPICEIVSMLLFKCSSLARKYRFDCEISLWRASRQINSGLIPCSNALVINPTRSRWNFPRPVIPQDFRSVSRPFIVGYFSNTSSPLLFLRHARNVRTTLSDIGIESRRRDLSFVTVNCCLLRSMSSQRCDFHSPYRIPVPFKSL